jgi:hypothetical protein
VGGWRGEWARCGARLGAWLTAGVLGLVLVVSPVSAQDAEQTAVARSLFRQGVEHSDQGRWPEAADHFRRSLALRDSPVVAFNLATALVHIGRLVEATEHFRRAARDAEAPERLREAARQQVDALQPRLARLTIQVTGPLESVELLLDGDPVPPARVGVAAPADPGLRVLRALRGDAEVARQEVTLAEGGEGSLSLVVPPPPIVEDRERQPDLLLGAGPPPSAVTPPAGDDTLLWVGVVVGAVLVVGAAAVTTGVVLGGQGPAPPIEGNLGPTVIVFE